MFSEGLVIDPISRQTTNAKDFINETSVYISHLGFAAYGRYDQFSVGSITVQTVALVSVADAYLVKNGDTAKVMGVLANDVDDRPISWVNTTKILGSVSLAANGLTLKCDPGSAFDFLALGQHVTETFTYTVLGWDGTSETQTVTMTITGGANEITGTSAANNLTGTVKRDRMLGLAGKDRLSGGDANDSIG